MIKAARGRYGRKSVGQPLEEEHDATGSVW
jgi:hypothetical protein